LRFNGQTRRGLAFRRAGRTPGNLWCFLPSPLHLVSYLLYSCLPISLLAGARLGAFCLWYTTPPTYSHTGYSVLIRRVIWFWLFALPAARMMGSQFAVLFFGFLDVWFRIAHLPRLRCLQFVSRRAWQTRLRPNVFTCYASTISRFNLFWLFPFTPGLFRGLRSRYFPAHSSLCVLLRRQRVVARWFCIYSYSVEVRYRCHARTHTHAAICLWTWAHCAFRATCHYTLSRPATAQHLRFSERAADCV